MLFRKRDCRQQVQMMLGKWVVASKEKHYLSLRLLLWRQLLFLVVDKVQYEAI